MADYEMRTPGGYPLGEATSALQKSIRRGMVKDAMYWALEINEKFPDYLWRRLCVIACEDIGPANPRLVGEIASIANMVLDIRKASKRKSYDAAMLGHAILMMATSPKSRQSDELVNEVLREMRQGLHLEVPDYALDMHTDRGRARGMGMHEFWTEGAKLENEISPQELGLGTGYVGYIPGQGDGYHDASGKGANPWPRTDRGDQMELDL